MVKFRPGEIIVCVDDRVASNPDWPRCKIGVRAEYVGEYRHGSDMIELRWIDHGEWSRKTGGWLASRFIGASGPW